MFIGLFFQSSVRTSGLVHHTLVRMVSTTVLKMAPTVSIVIVDSNLLLAEGKLSEQLLQLSHKADASSPSSCLPSIQKIHMRMKEKKTGRPGRVGVHKRHSRRCHVQYSLVTSKE